MSEDSNKKISFSLLNIDASGLKEPGLLLIEKVSSAIGAATYTWTRKWKANADAKAKITLSKADIEISELQERSLQRMLAEECKHQENMESITQKAIPNLDESANPKEIDDDWMANFFNKCRHISNDQMQDLWAKILAGEANRSGSFSRKTISILNDLSQEDALLFRDLCNFSWIVGASYSPIIFDPEETIYKDNGLSFNKLVNLDNIGLISLSSSPGYGRWTNSDSFEVGYDEKLYSLTLSKDGKGEYFLNIGKTLLTQPGEEILKVIETEIVDGFEEYVLNKWKNHTPKAICKISDRFARS
ncbi:DUF2806 domain-containing protein [Rubellicoccus peritrichatus]|uniref:DUF2806 domain-containing protein n=1 Tax=Rubellicoccus peritrichatus TaxID=3080537 RepID=A0AAQ3LCV4_9BACT|nr:DUF2806 domain-containing protein [Puniceicoccus sp. CR14]WOO43151.1 DUF2806 domain-containing protein [Puniceicoccus sp. CR14]